MMGVRQLIVLAYCIDATTSQTAFLQRRPVNTTANTTVNTTTYGAHGSTARQATLNSSLLSLQAGAPAPGPALSTLAQGLMLRAHPDDWLDVYWLTANLGLTKDYPWLGLYHAGIGFAVKGKGDTGRFVAEFYTDGNFDLSIFNPTVDYVNRNWAWTGRKASLAVYSEWKKGYWINQALVATIRGSEFNKVHEDIVKMKQDFKRYVLFNLIPPEYYNDMVGRQHLPGSFPHGDTTLPPGSCTCMDMAAQVLLSIEKVVGKQNFINAVNAGAGKVTRDDMFQVMAPGTVATKLDKEKDKEFIFEYFSKVDSLIKKALAEMAENKEQAAKTVLYGLVEMAKNKESMVYTDINEDYWKFEPYYVGPDGPDIPILFYKDSTNVLALPDDSTAR